MPNDATLFSTPTDAARNASLYDGRDAWIFDLDNTLYHPRHDLMAQIGDRMRLYVGNLLQLPPDEAHRVQKQYFRDHGTTLAGLIHHHDVEPEAYLEMVHDIVLDDLHPEPGLRDALAALPGQRYVFTNADADYAGRVLGRLGIADLFAGIHDVRASHYIPKPAQAAYDGMIVHFGIAPTQAVFVEDMARNLAPAHAMGMRTVWIDNGSESGDHDHDPAYVDVHVHDLMAWAQSVVAR